MNISKYKNNKRILLYFGHPAQFLMFRRTIKTLITKGWSVKIVLKTKDVLETLVRESGFEYKNILPKGRAGNRFSILFAILKRDIRMWKIVAQFKPQIMIGTDPSIAHISWLKGIYGITIIEDDAEIIKSLVRMTYPFTKTILCPEVCSVGKYTHKKIGYPGYMKLGYLHPNVFKHDKNITSVYNLPEKFILIRLSGLDAYHDNNIKGMSRDLLYEIIEKISKSGYDVRISAEFEPESKLLPFRLAIHPQDMHHVLCQAEMLIADSQSMSVEAALLGTPSIRYSGFAGKISVLEELEKKYALTKGIPVGEKEYLFRTIDEYLNMPDRKEDFQQRRKKMLEEKIDVSAFLIWFLENFPESLVQLKKNTNIQQKFVMKSLPHLVL